MPPPNTLPWNHGLLPNSAPYVLPSERVACPALVYGFKKPIDCVVMGILLETKS